MLKLALFFFALTLIFWDSVSAIEVLPTAHWVSGIVWHDVNNNSMRDDGEPPFPYVQVTLLAQTSSSLKLFSGPDELIEIQKTFTGVDGTYRFACLSPGSYAVRFYAPENRPSRFALPNIGSDGSIDSDVTFVQPDNRTAQTDLFLAESGGASYIDLGLFQYIFVNQFSLSGSQWVPSAPNTARGVAYTALNTVTMEMYFRVLRGEFPGQVTDLEGGYYRGWSDENGVKLFSFADRFSPKENVWLKITTDQLNDLMMGHMYTVIMGNGSFSSLARMRGQFYNFRNFRQLSLQAPLSGRNVVPSLDTSVSGMIDIQYNLDADSFFYDLTFTELDTSQIQKVGVYGPATVTTTGPLLVSLDPNDNMMNVSSIANFDQYFSGGKLYVQVSTTQFPNGQLRANLQGAQPVVFHSIFNLTNVGPSPIARAEAVFTLDWEKGELYYYVYIEGIYQDEVVTQLYNTRTGGFLDLDGPLCMSHENTVKQGYFFGISGDYLNDLYSGRVQILVDTKGGVELIKALTNWF